MAKLRVGIIGVAHMHVAHLVSGFVDLPDKFEFVSICDIKPVTPSLCKDDRLSTRAYNLKRVKEITGITKEYACYKELLAESRLDLAVVCCENAFHEEVITYTLNQKVHVMTEKPMATSILAARNMYYAAQKNNVMFCINWPSAWWPAIHAAKTFVDQGKIGRVFKVTYRNEASLGPFSHGEDLNETEMAAEWWYSAKMGGGAFWDYCCYGTCIASYLLDKAPDAAYGFRANFNSPFGKCEDYGNITVRYDDAIAIIEGSWSTVHTGIPNGPIVFGTKGTLVVDGETIKIFKDRYSKDPTEIYEAPPMDANRDDIAKEIVHHLETGEPLAPMLDKTANLRAMMILDAGYRSSLSGKLELADTFEYAVEKL